VLAAVVLAVGLGRRIHPLWLAQHHTWKQVCLLAFWSIFLQVMLTKSPWKGHPSTSNSLHTNLQLRWLPHMAQVLNPIHMDKNFSVDSDVSYFLS